MNRLDELYAKIALPAPVFSLKEGRWGGYEFKFAEPTVFNFDTTTFIGGYIKNNFSTRVHTANMGGSTIGLRDDCTKSILNYMMSQIGDTLCNAKDWGGSHPAYYWVRRFDAASHYRKDEFVEGIIALHEYTSSLDTTLLKKKNSPEAKNLLTIVTLMKDKYR